jgi:Flp pilus assembly protein TadD
MSSLRHPGLQGLFLAAVLGWAGMAHAECAGPEAMTAKMRAHPGSAEAVPLGRWYADHRQFECATEVFRAGLKAEPRSAQLHYLLGLSLITEGRASEGIPEVEHSAALDATAIKPHLLLGSLYDDQGNSDQADREWRRALAIDPKSEPALEGLTGLLMRRKDYPGVIQVLSDAPRTENLSIALARAFGLLNYPNQAAAVLTQALKEHPDSLDLGQAMLVVLVKQHKHEDAIKLARTLVEKHPGNMDVEMDLFRLLVLAEHLDEARVLGPKLLAARPKDPEVLYLNGLMERSAGNYEQAGTLLKEAEALQPDLINLHFELGNTLVILKQWQEARDELNKAQQAGDTRPELHAGLAKALQGLGDANGARQEMLKYQQMKKDEEGRLEAAESVAQGDDALKAGKTAEAVGHYRDAITNQPQNPSYHYKLAIALDRAGDSAGVRSELEQAIAINPNLAGPQNALGYLLSRSGESAAAVQHFQAAVDAAPGWSEAWINLAAELAVTGKFADARHAVGKALELDPQNQQAKELSDQLARDPRARANNP